MKLTLSLLLAGLAVASCGGGSSDADAQLEAAQVDRAVQVRQATSSTPAPVDAAAYMDWAQAQYAGNFPGVPATVQRSGFVFRYFPGSGNFIIVSTGGDVYHLGPLTQGQLLRVGSLSDFTCAVRAGSCSMPPAGVWVAYQNGVQLPVVFRFDGQGGYLQGEASGPTPGIERGTITVDAQGHYTAVVAQDTNGQSGLSNRSASALQNTLRLVGSEIVVSDAGGVEQFRFKRLPNDNTSLVGAWSIAPNASVAAQHVVFFPDGRYMMLDTVGDEGPSRCGGPGIEYGTYTYDKATGQTAITGVSVDTNGCAGLNEPKAGSLFGGLNVLNVVLSSNGNQLTSPDTTGYRITN